MEKEITPKDVFDLHIQTMRLHDLVGEYTDEELLNFTAEEDKMYNLRWDEWWKASRQESYELLRLGQRGLRDEAEKMIFAWDDERNLKNKSK